MNRLERLESLKKHPFTGNLFKKLTVSDTKFIDDFVTANADIPDHEFSSKTNRLFIDGNKPKNHTLIWSILVEMISGEIMEKRGKK